MSLKRKIPLLLAAVILACATPTRAERTTTIAGMVNLTNDQTALLVITDAPPEASFLIDTHKWVTEGQGFDDPYFKAKRLHVAIGQIDFTNRLVRAKENGVDMLYVPATTNLTGALAGKTFLLIRANFDDAIDLYASIKDRTILVHPDVHPSPLTISADAHDKTDAAAILEQALREKGTMIIADGEDFTWIVPVGITNVVLPAAMPARPLPEGLSQTNMVDTLPAGSINFINVPLSQVMEVYQALTARKWVQDKSLAGTFTFHSQTPLRKAEALHAFDVLLSWHGLKIVSVDDKSFKLVPLTPGQ